MPLERLGPYKLARMLGRGGMGAVYAAVNETTGEKAAIKLLSGHLADDNAFRQRFKQEVETLKRLLHPHIVQLYGYGEEDGHLYYAMELIEGRTLQDELQTGRRFLWREVVRLGIAISQALKHAHDRGIIHRDLKPANLLIDADEHVKLADFGIAKLYGSAQVTAAGGVLGTADYMSPEQARGETVTGRCDLYSLGCVLYALLCGRPPFVGKTVLEVVTALQNDDPVPVRYWAPDVPEPFGDIILQLLEKDPSRRIPTPLALMNQLRAMEHALSLETRIMIADDAASGPPPHNGPRTSTKTEIIKLASQPTEALPQPKTGIEQPGLSPDSPTSVANDEQGVQPSSRTAMNTQAGKKTGAGFASDRRTDVAPKSLTEKREGEAPAEPKTTSKASVSQFTTVTPEELRGTRDSDEGVFKQWLVAGAVAIVGVLAIAMAIYLATRPPSADRLIASIKAVADRQEPGELVAVEAEMKRFLDLYPADQRAGEVEGLVKELAQYRLQRQAERRGRGASNELGETPVELAYAEAVRLASFDPETALAQFEALLAVFGDATAAGEHGETEEKVPECLELARKQIERLRPEVNRMIADQQAAVRRELDRADRLAQTNPSAARPIWQGIITLYRDKAWAKPLVEIAEARLAGEIRE
jgi:serine/threonine protein kinase